MILGGSAQARHHALDRDASAARPAVHVHVGAAAARGRRTGRNHRDHGRVAFREGPGRARVLEAVRAIGPESFFVGSDSGLVGTPNHTDALVMAARVLRQNGFDEQALDAMFKDNPARLLGLPIL